LFGGFFFGGGGGWERGGWDIFFFGGGGGGGYIADSYHLAGKVWGRRSYAAVRDSAQGERVTV